MCKCLRNSGRGWCFYRLECAGGWTDMTIKRARLIYNPTSGREEIEEAAAGYSAAAGAGRHRDQLPRHDRRRGCDDRGSGGGGSRLRYDHCGGRRRHAV